MITPPDLKKEGRRDRAREKARSIGRLGVSVRTPKKDCYCRLSSRGMAMAMAMLLRVEMSDTYVCDNVLPSKGS